MFASLVWFISSQFTIILSVCSVKLNLDLFFFLSLVSRYRANLWEYMALVSRIRMKGSLFLVPVYHLDTQIPQTLVLRQPQFILSPPPAAYGCQQSELTAFPAHLYRWFPGRLALVSNFLEGKSLLSPKKQHSGMFCTMRPQWLFCHSEAVDILTPSRAESRSWQVFPTWLQYLLKE